MHTHAHAHLCTCALSHTHTHTHIDILRQLELHEYHKKHQRKIERNVNSKAIQINPLVLGTLSCLFLHVHDSTSAFSPKSQWLYSTLLYWCKETLDLLVMIVIQSTPLLFRHAAFSQQSAISQEHF